MLSSLRLIGAIRDQVVPIAGKGRAVKIIVEDMTTQGLIGRNIVVTAQRVFVSVIDLRPPDQIDQAVGGVCFRNPFFKVHRERCEQ